MPARIRAVRRPASPEVCRRQIDGAASRAKRGGASARELQPGPSQRASSSRGRVRRGQMQEAWVRPRRRPRVPAGGRRLADWGLRTRRRSISPTGSCAPVTVSPHSSGTRRLNGLGARNGIWQRAASAPGTARLGAGGGSSTGESKIHHHSRPSVAVPPPRRWAAVQCLLCRASTPRRPRRGMLLHRVREGVAGICHGGDRRRPVTGVGGAAAGSRGGEPGRERLGSAMAEAGCDQDEAGGGRGRGPRRTQYAANARRAGGVEVQRTRGEGAADAGWACGAEAPLLSSASCRRATSVRLLPGSLHRRFDICKDNGVQYYY
jgi:hypothetical protein